MYYRRPRLDSTDLWNNWPPNIRRIRGINSFFTIINSPVKLRNTLQTVPTCYSIYNYRMTISSFKDNKFNSITVGNILFYIKGVWKQAHAVA